MTPHRATGVTLLETLVVLAILGIIAGIGVITYQRWAQRTQADAAVADVQRVITAARARIRTHNRDVTLRVDSAARTITVTQAPDHTATYAIDARTLDACQRTPTAGTDTCTPTTTVTLRAPYGTLGTDLRVRVGTATVTRDAYLLGPTALLQVRTP